MGSSGSQRTSTEGENREVHELQSPFFKPPRSLNPDICGIFVRRESQVYGAGPAGAHDGYYRHERRQQLRGPIFHVGD